MCYTWIRVLLRVGIAVGGGLGVEPPVHVMAAPPPFRPGNPALCGSHPLVTPYYCRLGDLLCFVFICMLIVCLISLCTICTFSALILLVGSFDL